MLRKLYAGVCLILLLCAGPGLAAITLQRLVHGTTTAVLSISSLTNNSRTTAGTTYDPRIGQTGSGYLDAYLECVMTFGTAPTAGTSIAIYLLRSNDGTNFENSDTNRVPDVVCPVLALTSAQRVGAFLRLPAMRFKALALNDGTGQTLTSGTINLTPTTIQGN